MKDEDLFKIDLNTLKVLKVLGHEQSTKRAAERLGIGQPAVSKALKKLREQFDDQLFYRTLHGLEPTPKCQTILGLLPKIMDQVKEVFESHSRFDPSSYEGVLSLHINPSLCHPLSMMLIHALHTQAPKASLMLEDWSDTTDQQIKNGAVNLGINFYPLKTVPGLSSKIVCQPSFKFCCRQGHPLTQKDAITVEDVANSPLVLVSMAGYTGSESITESYLKRVGYLPNVLFRSDRLDACADVIRATDAIAPVSEIVHPVVQDQGLALLNLKGFDDVQHNSIAHYVSEQARNTPLLDWLIDAVEAEIKQLIDRYSNTSDQYVYDTLSQIERTSGGRDE
ncbi:LysR family transcriptional regulator [Agarivorans sp. TSD2052]|uniref:LysR family transcriptional regulator n=1 Tax=Agarivorans sp. TSD2052 TaxID=2937286 RepID=UPI00200E2945|nr:LysR family transcriptional regulator [Agarivorans sp. TSD2052]UPW19455.1 LysR family transcriptional regulator [Agarivorans sp. TSD2052]